MSRILLYIDLSPSWPWVFATIHANRALLLEHGIVIGPSDPWLCDIIPSSRPLWAVPTENQEVPPHLVKWIEEVSDHLVSGHDVLLMTYYTPFLSGQNLLTSMIQKHVDLKRHSVHCFYTIGRPACLLEQRYMEVWSPLSESEGQRYVNLYSNLSEFVKGAYDTWGYDNVTLLEDLSESPVVKPRDDLSRRLFTHLGCSHPSAPQLPLHPLFLSSQEGRLLRWALEVRNNAWPQVDNGLLMECLIQAERTWDAAPLSPKKNRDALISNGLSDLRELESLIGLNEGSLDCPPWLSEAPEAQEVQQLSADQAEAFCAVLPRSVATLLQQRFINDSSLLTKNQVVLASALSSVSAVNATIGEPIAPISLTVLTMTFNHQDYIADCIESVLAQNTDFPVRHLVLDHCSTDSTPDIIASYARDYPSIQPILLSKRLPNENVTGLFVRCHSCYTALCDGDDYFTDPLKLQKQVNFLENNKHCGLCFHPVSVRYEDGCTPPETYPPLSMLPRGVRSEYYLADLLQGNMIQTNSVVYRWRFQDGLPSWFRPELCPGDWYWHLLHAEVGKIGFLQDVMSVYRRHRNALYYTSTISTVEHRKIHGMSELGTYYAVNEHFKNRYFIRLASLANGVFANFLEIYLASGDDALLEQACRLFPEFGQFFFNSLKFLNNNSYK